VASVLAQLRGGAAAGPVDPGGHALLPVLRELVVEDRQGDVGQQRGEDAALRGAGLGVPGDPVLGQDPRSQGNALTSATTRLSAMRARTRASSAVCEIRALRVPGRHPTKLVPVVAGAGTRRRPLTRRWRRGESTRAGGQPWPAAGLAERARRDGPGSERQAQNGHSRIPIDQGVYRWNSVGYARSCICQAEREDRMVDPKLHVEGASRRS
jgi:hypothetical protein